MTSVIAFETVVEILITNFFCHFYFVHIFSLSLSLSVSLSLSFCLSVSLSFSLSLSLVADASCHLQLTRLLFFIFKKDP